MYYHSPCIREAFRSLFPRQRRLVRRRVLLRFSVKHFAESLCPQRRCTEASHFLVAVDDRLEVYEPFSFVLRFIRIGAQVNESAIFKVDSEKIGSSRECVLIIFERKSTLVLSVLESGAATGACSRGSG